jgi:hypothetical protein
MGLSAVKLRPYHIHSLLLLLLDSRICVVVVKSAASKDTAAIFQGYTIFSMNTL